MVHNIKREIFNAYFNILNYISTQKMDWFKIIIPK